jgi:hypothetical protein
MDGAMSVVWCHSVFQAVGQRVVPLAVILSRFTFREIWLFRENIVCPRSDAALFLDQNLAFSGVIGLADDAFQFHALHQ